MSSLFQKEITEWVSNLCAKVFPTTSIYPTATQDSFGRQYIGCPSVYNLSSLSQRNKWKLNTQGR